MKPINISDKLNLITEHWAPKIVAELNGQQVKLAKIIGEFTWHSHPDADELFFVINGSLRIELRDHSIHLNPGDLVVIPRGTEHKPVADEEVQLMLFEPVGTVNTGDKPGEKTREAEWI